MLKKEEIIKNSIKNLPIIKGVYFLINNTEQIVYIGKSKDCYNRIKTHKVNNGKLFTRYFIFDTGDADMGLIETEYINKFKPFYNKLDNPDRRKFINVVLQKSKKYKKGGRPKGISERLKTISPKVKDLYEDESYTLSMICSELGLAPNSIYKCLDYMGVERKKSYTEIIIKS